MTNETYSIGSDITEAIVAARQIKSLGTAAFIIDYSGENIASRDEINEVLRDIAGCTEALAGLLINRLMDIENRVVYDTKCDRKINEIPIGSDDRASLAALFGSD
ncbi:MAG: hypothetical protein AB1717_05940 [Pseudomonadota bacterium]